MEDKTEHTFAQDSVPLHDIKQVSLPLHEIVVLRQSTDCCEQSITQEATLMSIV